MIIEGKKRRRPQESSEERKGNEADNLKMEMREKVENVELANMSVLNLS